MKVLCDFKTSLQKTCLKIHLIDKCLIVIMFFLLLQSSYSLFCDAAVGAVVNAIDIIIRTATASIFGYFLSSNFMRHDHSKVVEPEKLSAKQDTENRLKIIVTTSIAVFCLLVLIIVRNISGIEGIHFTASAQATISQFRDLISGSIGFLIGAPTTKK